MGSNQIASPSVGSRGCFFKDPAEEDLSLFFFYFFFLVVRDGARASSTSSRGSLQRDPVQKPAGPSCVSHVLSSEGCPSRIPFPSIPF